MEKGHHRHARATLKADEGMHVMCNTRYGNVMASRGLGHPPLHRARFKNGLTRSPLTDPDMTRFMMSLGDAVDLVVYAFQHALPGDLFIEKASSVTIGTLAEAVKRVFQADNPIQVIGTRHGEKLYETLLTREEMVRAVDLGNYYRVPADVRDLNYAKYFSDGQSHLAQVEDYHSHNVRQLNVEEMAELLLTLPCIQEELAVDSAKPSARRERRRARRKAA